ncbi:MAG: hypothetical protein IJL92_10265 [Thermoguttaceae bacterium]|nr:hypothetical protein [Thermoguttaceae bacterium]
MRNRTIAPTIIPAFLLSLCAAMVQAQDQNDLTVDGVAERYEAQWNEVSAMRLGFRRETRTRTATNSFDNCYWEMIGEKAKVVESRLTSFPSNPLNPDSKPITANVISECYYDGEKTYEIAEPTGEWPLATVELADYEKLRRRGVRASISNRNKHWRFWFSCPIPRFFSIPGETDLLTLTDLVKKYDSKIVKHVKSDHGEDLVQIEIRNDSVVGSFSAMFRSWALYISLNMDKNFAVAGYQLSVTLNRESNEKLITEYTADEFRELAPYGIWLPMKVEYREHTGGMRSSLTRIGIRSDSIYINEPSENFDSFHFLPGMVVHEEIWPDDSDKSRPRVLVHIWGQDGAPVKTFPNDEAFYKFFVEKFGADSFSDDVDARFKVMGRRRRAALLVGACLCLIAFGVLVYRTRRAIKRDRELEDEDAATE